MIILSNSPQIEIIHEHSIFYFYLLTPEPETYSVFIFIQHIFLIFHKQPLMNDQNTTSPLTKKQKQINKQNTKQTFYFLSYSSISSDYKPA